MKASFSISASVSPPGSYGEQSSANHSGQLVVDVTAGTSFDQLTPKDVSRLLVSLRAEFNEVCTKVEHGLLATIAEKKALVERAKEEAAAKALADSQLADSQQF